MLAGLLTATVLLSAACTAATLPSPTQQSVPNPSLNSAVTITPPTASASTTAPPPSTPPSTPGSPTVQETARTLTGEVQVSRVFDGDTLYARLAGDDVPVRFLGINAPEVVHPAHPKDDCFGPEARALTRTLLGSMTAQLTYDRTQGDKDRYGRYLRYVDTSPAGQDVALTLISQGLAKEYTYSKAYARQAEYRAAQAEAKAAHKGGWAALPDGCGWS